MEEVAAGLNFFINDAALKLLEGELALGQANKTGQLAEAYSAAQGLDFASQMTASQVIVNQYISGNVTTERELFDNYVDAIFQINRQGTNSQLVNLGR